MELEHALPEISRCTDGDRVLAACRKFADVLTDRGWDHDTVLRAGIHREVKRIVTMTEPVLPMGILKTQKNVTVSVDFLAEKEQIAFDEDSQRALYEETFKISAQLREQVRPDELPDWILDVLKKKPLFVNSRNTDDEGDTLSDANEDEPELNAGVLLSTDFEKVTEIEYVLDVDGDIEDYTVTCRYHYDDMHIDERSSGWGVGAIEYVDEVMDGEVTVTDPYGHDALSEEDIHIFEESFDSVMKKILTGDNEEGNELDDSEESRALRAEQEDELDSHYRRALGMIALNSQRFIGMRIK